MRAMTVADLIAKLECMDQEAEVRIMSQASYPFENALAGVAARTDWVEDVETCRAYLESPVGCTDDGCDLAHDEPTPLGRNQPLNTVFLVEGYQICYGSKHAWDAL